MILRRERLQRAPHVMYNRAQYPRWRSVQTSATVALTLKPNQSAEVLPLLRELRQRFIVRSFLNTFAASLLVAGAVVVLVAAWRHFAAPGEGVGLALPLILLVSSAVFSGVFVMLTSPDLHQLAMLVDRAGNTRDRLLTALVLGESSEGGSPLSHLAQAECREYLAKHDLTKLISTHPPRMAGWIAVPLIAWAIFAWQASVQHARLAAERAEAQKAIAGTTNAIDQLANEAEKAAEQTRSDEFRKLAEQLQKSAERLRTETNSEEAQKAALRELSSLEEMMRELQRQPSPADELKELTKALTTLPGMEDVLNALNEKDLAEAQRAMDRAMQKQNENKPDQLTEEQVEKQLQQAMKRLGDQRRLSEALQKFAEQAKKQAGGGGMTEQAMKQLQQMMQQMSRQQQGDADSGQKDQRQMTLQEMIAALENMKFGEGQANQGSESQDVPGGPQVSIDSFGSTNPQGQPQLGDAKFPSGRPGSERDFGTTDTPFGGKSDPQDKGGELALKGKLGQGESLSMMMPSAADNSKSARRYKELVEAAAASAEDAVEQEDIPLGSRFLVKKYFESIRPK